MADNTKYQKVLQLYRSTNVWDTKNIAKAEVEIHAKQLHPEILKGLRDGEPIIAKYYDKADGYTFGFSALGPNTNPYSGENSATHIWVEGFDSFKSNEFDTGTKKIRGIVPNYDSPAYIRVDNSGTYTYYKLTVSKPSTPPSRTTSSVFGVGLINNGVTYIEWFDSAAEAKGAIGDLNYNDKDLENGFVAKVNQKDGKIESIHGNITGENATVVTDNRYSYVKLGDSTTIPDDYIWDTTNSGNALPSNVDESRPKYYHVTGSTTETQNGYYELRKNIEVTLKITDTNNVLAQGSVTKWKLLNEAPSGHEFVDGETFTSIPTITSSSPEYIRVGADNNYRYYQKETTSSDSGLSTNFTLRSLSPTEVSALGSNVRDAYKLVGNANGTETTIGDTIKIYKDSSLIDVYLGHVDDHITSPTNPVVISGTGSEALCFIYQKSDGTYELVAIDLESFLLENEFKDGFEIKNGGYSYGEISYDPYADDSSKWITEGQGQNVFSELPSSVTSTSPEYIRVDTTIEETTTSKYYKRNSAGEVYVKLTSDGGLDFKNEGTGINKSLKIKIDSTNTNEYYRLATDSELEDNNVTKYNYVDKDYWVDGTTSFSTPPEATEVSKDYIRVGNEDTGWTYYQKNENDGVYSYEPIKYDLGEYVPDSDGKYVRDTYFHTTTKGLAIDQAVLENKITDNVGKVLFVNNEPFVKDNDGNIKAIVIGEDITVAGVGSNGQSKPMTNIVLVDGIVPVPQSSLPTPSDTTPDYVLLTAQVPYVLYKKGTSAYEPYTTQNNDEYIEANGFIYHWNENGNKYELYFINKDTNLNDAISILNYLTYNLDMGQF